MLAHALLLVLGKVLMRFFEVGDCESVLDSVRWDFVFESLNLDSESIGVDYVIVLDSMEGGFNFLNLDSEFESKALKLASMSPPRF